MVNFQIPVELDAGRRWLEAGRPLVSRDDPHLHAAVDSVRIGVEVELSSVRHELRLVGSAA